MKLLTSQGYGWVVGYATSLFSFYFLAKYIGLLFQTQGLSNKSFYMVFLMYIGESLCLVTYKLFYTKSYEILESIDLETNDSISTKLSIKQKLWVSFQLSLLDLIASSLLMISFQWISISTLALLRTSTLVFQTYLSKRILQVSPSRSQKIGIAFVLIGNIVFNLNMTETTDSNAFLGIVLAISSVFVYSLQSILHQKNVSTIHPLQLIGLEGVIGVGMTTIVLVIAQYLPGSDQGKVLENTENTLNILFDSLFAMLASFLYMASKYIYNGAGMMCLSYFSSLTIELGTSICNCMLWLLSLLVYYSGNKELGESITSYWPLQLLGMMIAIYGNVRYYR